MEINFGKTDAIKQQANDYLTLIDQLLKCASGEESQILKINQDLIDASLVEVMAQVADALVQRGNTATADFLIDLSAQIVEVLGLSNKLEDKINPQSKESTIANSEGSLELLLDVLQAIDENRGNSQKIHRILAQNLEKLDKQFADVLRDWVKNVFVRMAPEQVTHIAEIINIFSNIIYDFPLGDRANNLEIALTGFEITLSVLSLQPFRNEWAMNQVQLGNIYLNRVRGKRAENLELAVDHYHKALQIYTLNTSPENWAIIQNNLGNAYSERIFSDRAENLELAIAHYHKALEIYTRASFPENWATTQNNLGTVYSNRIIGDRAANLEEAIFCYQAALEVRNRDEFPLNWAMTHNNLAISYSNRIQGDKAANLEKALAYYQAALEIYTCKEFPEDWAMTCNNLGITYRDRIYGDKAENLEIAIQCYEAALQVRTRSAFPKQWAATQNNLGIAYSERILGNRYENLESAASCYQASSQIYTRASFPERWATTQNNLGNAYRELGQISESLTCYQNALKIFTPTTFPIDCLRTGRNLGNTAFSAQLWDTAIEGFADAIEAVEQSHSWATSELRREEILEEANDIYEKIVQSYIIHGQVDKAIEYIDRSKARNLIDLIATRDIQPKGDIPTDVFNEFKRLQGEIKTEYWKTDFSTQTYFDKNNINSLKDTKPNRTHLNQLRQKLTDLISREIQSIDPAFSLIYRVEPLSFKEIQALLPDENTSIIEWYITDNTFFTFIITRQAIEPIVWQSSSEDREALVNWVKKYLQNYSENKTQWKSTLSKSFQCLAQILHIDKILSYLPLSCNQLILIPHRFLHLFPLHALPLAKKGYCLLDDFTKGVSYTPNCQMLRLSQKKDRSNFKHLFAIQNPTQDLIFTELEVEEITQNFQSSNILVKQAATKKEVLSNYLLKDAHCVHFSCHGHFDFENPLSSALILADGIKFNHLQQDKVKNQVSSENGNKFNLELDLEKCLTLGDILNLNLNECRLVILSACESGLIDSSGLSEEYISLATGFLVAGSRSVVSSLWAVDDLSTTLLMIEFYKNMQIETSIATALSQAQLWLRDVTIADLKPWLMQRQLVLTNRQLEISLQRWFSLFEANEQPFQSPYYWAGFHAVG